MGEQAGARVLLSSRRRPTMLPRAGTGGRHVTIDELNELLSPYGPRRVKPSDQSEYSWATPDSEDDAEE